MEAGESFKHLAEIKYNLEDNVKQNFIEPLTQTQNKDLKEVNVSNSSSACIVSLFPVVDLFIHVLTTKIYR